MDGVGLLLKTFIVSPWASYPLGPEVFCMKVGVMNLHPTIAVVSKDFSVESSICGCPKLLSITTVLFIAFMYVDT